MWMLEQARDAGRRARRGRLTSPSRSSAGRVTGVEIAAAYGPRERVATGCLVNAAGPLAAEVGRLAGVDLPLLERAARQGLPRRRRAGRAARAAADDLVRSGDPRLGRRGARRRLAADPELAYLTRPLPGGVHFRPEGGRDRPHAPAALHLPPRRRRRPFGRRSSIPGTRRSPCGRCRPDGARLRRSTSATSAAARSSTAATTARRPRTGFWSVRSPVAGLHLLCGLSGYGIMAAAAGPSSWVPISPARRSARLRRRVSPRPLRRSRLPRPAGRGEFASGSCSLIGGAPRKEFVTVTDFSSEERPVAASMPRGKR